MDRLLHLMDGYRYLVIFLASLGEAVGLPIPAELTLLIAGARRNELNS